MMFNDEQRKKLSRSFSENLKKLRKQADLSQMELCGILDIGQSKLSEWENAKRLPNSWDLYKLSDLFECSIDYLVGRDAEKTRDLQELQDVTGLSHGAINTLVKWHKVDERGQSCYDDNGDFLAGSHISDLNTILEEYPDILYDIARGISGSYNENDPYSCASDDYCIGVAIKLQKYKDSKKKVIPSDKDRIDFATAYISKKMKTLIEQHEYDRAQLAISRENMYMNEDTFNASSSLEEAVNKLSQAQKRFLIEKKLWSGSFNGKSLDEYERLYERVCERLSVLYGKRKKSLEEGDEISKLEDISGSLGEGVANSYSKSLIDETDQRKNKSIF